MKHKNAPSSLTLWSVISYILDILNGNGNNTADGISEDESETDEHSRPKLVRIRARPWINKAIPELMHTVDTYGQSKLDELGHQHQGNSSLPRVYVAKKDDIRPYMVGLPRNFYDDDWYKTLDEVEKSIVDANEEVVDIPFLVWSFFSTSDAQLAHVHHFKKGSIQKRSSITRCRRRYRRGCTGTYLKTTILYISFQFERRGSAQAISARAQC